MSNELASEKPSDSGGCSSVDLKYASVDEHLSITIEQSAVAGLKAYAIEVLKKMQMADPEYADCWTACQVTFDEICPRFCWSSIEDADRSEGIVFEFPATKDH